VAAGDDVAFATAAGFCPAVERAGFRAFPAGLSLPDQLRLAAERFPEQHALPHGRERFEAFVPRMLAGVAAPARAADLLGLLEAWRPDVLVHDETDFGGPVAATVAGIPYADHSVGPLRPLDMARLARATLEPLWSEHGVDLGEFGGLFHHLYLDVCPPSLQSPEIALVPVAQRMQNTAIDTGDERLPEWIERLRAVPVVYVSLGTIFNQRRDVFGAILDGLHGEDVEVIVTVGAENDPAALGSQPDNVHVERFIPQSALLPRCDVAVNQGGTAILPILAHGLPMLLVPQGANQFHNAQACTAAGVARALNPGEVTADAVRRDVHALLQEPAYRERAAAVARELAAMPGPDEGVRRVRRLAQDGVVLAPS
ncbi:MAG TPA: nucleotide disphospho-sugar-binding domain-containing protein, partial [Candidatus Dormibacteraeota bacterium]|nr:nucleotide disphospho-sugar-binding domain-containing protein [Candidatus Dormibacteraeota bacterium]